MITLISVHKNKTKTYNSENLLKWKRELIILEVNITSMILANRLRENNELVKRGLVHKK